MADDEHASTGQRTGRNLEALRDHRRMTKRQLSERLEEVGHPMTLDVLIKAETGRRRIDVDDLLALALALDVSPNRLLLTSAADRETLALTPRVSTTARKAWRWARGVWPLSDEPRYEAVRLRRFWEENDPETVGSLTLEEAFEKEPVMRPVVEAAQAAVASGEVTIDDLIVRLRFLDHARAIERGIDDGSR